MTMLLFLIPISIILLGVAVGFFVWAVKQGQFDDLDTPALDILQDEPLAKQHVTSLEPEASAETAEPINAKT